MQTSNLHIHHLYSVMATSYHNNGVSMMLIVKSGKDDVTALTQLLYEGHIVTGRTSTFVGHVFYFFLRPVSRPLKSHAVSIVCLPHCLNNRVLN